MTKPILVALAALPLLAAPVLAQGINNGSGAAPAAPSHTGSGMSSQPPGSGIGGNNPGSMGSTGTQGASGGNMGPNSTSVSQHPTGSGAPGTGPGSASGNPHK
ncbi:hypothetical protein M446_6627 [Methylobacterium sp. 4-46]|uniref:hypothetical protein n=1 Tax=unclassified Methylobacterium TaxID=2615210 RepID=UPI000165CBF5|nr:MULTISPECIES: hypothetical protein [Methylobacterium]ACA20881.1 hypothetical protein M446_6627 [Methylobacterium sp. 4-46]WFT80035.1 hypothetical protein QA634_33460 [Methylobacterium nodulans]